MDIKQFQTDDEKRDGVWLEFEDAQFLIAYAHRPQFAKVTGKVSKKYPAHKLRNDATLMTKMTIEIIADAILLDWKNVKEGGKDLPCTRENKIRLLNIEPFREWVSIESREIQNFREEAEAEDAEDLKSDGGVATPVGEG